MSLSASLYQGYVSIIGGASITGITTNNVDIQFGVIDQIFTTPQGVSVGDSIMFNIKDTINIAYSGTTYFLLPIQKIILVEIILS